MKLIQSGPRSAKIVLVGEAPGANEAREGIPFIGGAGHLLDQMLQRAGINRSQCFVTNVAHVQPPKNDFKWFLTKAGQPALISGILQLKKDLEEIKPNLVIALGAQPLQILAGKQGIGDWRGSILPTTLVPGLKVIGTYHPAAILRVWDYKGVADFDLARCANEASTPIIHYPSRTFYLPDANGNTTLTTRVGTQWVDSPEPQHIEPIIEEMLAAEYLSLDIECWKASSGKWELACVGFSDRPDRALVLLPSQMHAIRRLCMSSSKKVMQNGQFDYTVLLDNGIETANFDWDTMLAHHALYAESAGGGDEVAALTGKKRSAAFAKGLAFQTSIYTREPFYKADGKLWRETNDLRMFYRYNALDAAVTKEIQEVQQRELADFGTMKIFRDAMDLIHPVMRATRTGIRIDPNVRAQMRERVETKINNLQKFVEDSIGEPLNVKSNPQMVHLLYEKLKLPVRTGKSGRLTADKDTLVDLGNRFMNPVLHSIITLRQQRDLKERYLDSPVDPDMRMRCSFDLTGTRSGRLSSRASLSGSGTNIQNQPEEMRQMYVADPGCSFVYRDYSQAEARVVAYQSRCEGLIELFADPTRDVHTENAARIFGHKVAVLEKYGGPVTATQRYLAKRVVHACNYGMGAARLVEVVNEDSPLTGVRITLPQARELINKYFMLYPEIQQNFWREVEQELRHTRTLNTPFGRRRMFFGRWDDKLLREAYSYVPQSTVGDLARLAWIRIADRLDKLPHLNAMVLVNVHDSILVQCRDEATKEVALLMEEAMRIEINLGPYSFTIPTDCKIGKNWGNYDEKENPLGLIEWEAPDGTAS